MSTHRRQPLDCNGSGVQVGSRVRVLSLSGDWYDKLPPDERAPVDSMIGEIFEIEEIDEYGQPWVCKRWADEVEGTCQSHSIALEPKEMLSIDAGITEVPVCGPAVVDLARALRDLEEFAAGLNSNGDGPHRA